MLTFGNAKLARDEGVKIIAAAPTGRRVISILLENAEVRDKADYEQRYSSRIFDIDIDIEINGSGEEFCEILFGAWEQHSDVHGFGVARLTANGVKATARNIQEGVLEGQLTINVKDPLLRLSTCLLANAGPNANNNESYLQLYKVELRFLKE